ncbi:hypothetical protein ACEZ3G_15250 [Maribacter algicola]|uniref:Uncharacterized protein n=1 Tax=Meishania litoralis TaxID=3434685 RepID=A0ACC7LNM1_9FLAO
MRIFSETQRFDQWWIKLIYVAMIGFLLFCAYNWYIANKPTGNVSAHDTTAQIAIFLSIIPVLFLMYSFNLKTRIDDIGIHYRFFPFQLNDKTVRWEELQNCYVRKYSPIKEFGGWGYRGSFGKKRKALNVKGNKGIQLEFASGKRLLIGTQKEAEAKQVIQRYFKHKS